MAFNFPDSPNVNDEYTAGDRTWVWDGTVWLDKGSTLSFSELTDSSHASTHGSGGADEITIAQSQVTNLTTDLGSKQDNITGAASTITDSNLTANRAVISDGSGKVTQSPVTATELSRLDGVTSSIQTQLNGKADLDGATFTGRVTASDPTEAQFSVRNIYISTGDPSGGVDGDVWLKY